MYIYILQLCIGMYITYVRCNATNRALPKTISEQKRAIFTAQVCHNQPAANSSGRIATIGTSLRPSLLKDFWITPCEIPGKALFLVEPITPAPNCHGGKDGAGTEKLGEICGLVVFLLKGCWGCYYLDLPCTLRTRSSGVEHNNLTLHLMCLLHATPYHACHYGRIWGFIHT